ncbi:MAG: hypothetical protein EAZ08_07715 [Cytophagales bacterium]|nr:MAG: hypothetical protein EAZ08_07715 [Cytophagales bacterium]
MMEVSYTEDLILKLVEQFRTKKLSKEDWTHHAHLIVAVWHIKNYDFFEAVCRLKSGIILLNDFHQTENTSKSGYHETITIFWANAIKLYISMFRELPLEQLVNNFLTSNLSNKDILFKFYDRANLMTANLRTIYEAPMLKELNELAVRDILTENPH